MYTKFDEIEKFDDKLKQAARVAAEDVIQVQKDEEVLIVTNPSTDVFRISQAFYDACITAGGKPTLIIQPVKTQMDYAEEAVIGALEKEPAIIISISKEKMGKDTKHLKDPLVAGDKKYNHIFNYLLGEKKSRSFWSPTLDLRMFRETVPIDYTQMRNECDKVAEVMDWADEIHVSSPSGTDVTIGTRGRISRKDNGDFSKPGQGGNLPAGEVFVSPELGTGTGMIAFDGSIASDKGEIVIETPIMCKIENNRVIDINGDHEAHELLNTIIRGENKALEMSEEGTLTKEDAEEYKTNARNLGELGIGLNHAANIVGNMLEDEKVYKTCHFAIGANYDDDANALIHLDGLVKNPTITCLKDGIKKIIIQDGELLL